MIAMNKKKKKNTYQIKHFAQVVTHPSTVSWICTIYFAWFRCLFCLYE